MKFKFLVLLVGIILFTSSCEDIYDKEKRYTKELNVKFDSELLASTKSVFFDIEDADLNVHRKFSENPIDLTKYTIAATEWTLDSHGNQIIAPFHQLNMELLGRSYNVSYNLDEIDYLLHKVVKFEEVGTYVDAEGKEDWRQASIGHQYLFLHDLNNNRTYLLVKHVGDEPKKELTREYESGMVGYWHSEDFMEALLSKSYFKKIGEANRAFTREEYINFIDEKKYLP